MNPPQHGRGVSRLDSDLAPYFRSNVKTHPQPQLVSYDCFWPRLRKNLEAGLGIGTVTVQHPNWRERSTIKDTNEKNDPGQGRSFGFLRFLCARLAIVKFRRSSVANNFSGLRRMSSTEIKVISSLLGSQMLNGNKALVKLRA